MKRHLILGIIVLVFLLKVPTVSADRGMIPVNPSISVYEPGQKAIIAWNGVEEGLILSTNVSSEGKTKVVEMIPLPSKPEKVEKASFESFEKVQSLTIRHGFRLMEGRGKEGAMGGSTAPEIVLHKKIGLHDITVAKAKDKEGLLEWVADFLSDQGVRRKISLGEFDPVVEDYLRRGFNYWVVDLIEVEKEKSVRPIYYEFDSDFLYYPLEITRPVGGSGKVSLFLLTEEKVEGDAFPLKKAQYNFQDGESEPIEFKVSPWELKEIDDRIADLFAFENGAYFTGLSYDGPMTGLDRDLVLHDQPGSSASPPEVSFEPHIEIELGKHVVILAVLVAIFAGVGAFLGTYFGSGSDGKGLLNS